MPLGTFIEQTTILVVRLFRLSPLSEFANTFYIAHCNTQQNANSHTPSGLFQGPGLNSETMEGSFVYGPAYFYGDGRYGVQQLLEKKPELVEGRGSWAVETCNAAFESSGKETH